MRELEKFQTAEPFEGFENEVDAKNFEINRFSDPKNYKLQSLSFPK